MTPSLRKTPRRVRGRTAGALALLVLLAVAPVRAQEGLLYDQSALARLLDRQGALEAVPDPSTVDYRPYVLAHPTGNSVWARHVLYAEVGEGDVRRGRDRVALAALLNGRTVTDLAIGDTLLLPARAADFDLDVRAFAPFPAEYPGAAGYDKLVIVHKDVQAWASYANGRLVRWGPASTGARATPTPTGRFTMNWRQPERISSESPEGQEWHMRWVMNIHAPRGIHIHQYAAVPTGAPEGHGCIRVVEADARWLYDWTEPWMTTAGPGALGGRVTAPGTTVLVLGAEPDGPPPRFTEGPRGPRRFVVELPPDPAAVPRGDR